MAEAAEAMRSDAAGLLPFRIEAKKKPVKVSPAAVVSTTGALKIPWRYRLFRSAYMAPLLPSVSTIRMAG